MRNFVMAQSVDNENFSPPFDEKISIALVAGT